ncbi:MAG: glycine/betaine ABC transporter substrate-binding protein [Chloroflexi bacterium]|nr:glycine/betaine ABC transporter substrate-binding protein [Chloroflexota bacterium]
MEKEMHRFGVVPLGALILLMALSACAPAAAPGAQKPSVTVGSTNFGEQIILAELYAQALEANEYPVERRFNLGSREIVAPALESGEIDLYPEYLATYLTFLTGDSTKASSDAARTHEALQEALRAKNATVLDYASAANVNGFVVTKATADRHRLSKVSDLARVGNQLVLGGPPECPQRPFCLQGLEKSYGLKFKDFTPLDVGGPMTVAALEGNQIDVAVLFTTDAVIPAKGFVLLEDDEKLQLADNVAPVVRNDLLNEAPDDFETAVNGVTAKLTTQQLTELNRQVGIDRKSEREVAAAWLSSQGLVR